MLYTVGEMARETGMPASTLRYYDKEGLLPFVERTGGGIRMFSDSGYVSKSVYGTTLSCLIKPNKLA